MNSSETSPFIYTDTPSNPAIAYLRPVTTPQGKGFAVCSADGSQLAVFATRDAAFFAAKQHDLEPVNLH